MPFSRRGGSVGKIFLITYNLKRKKKKTFELTPPPPKLQSIYFLFPTTASFSLSLLEVILGHISVTDSRERWEGEKKNKKKTRITVYFHLQ